MTAAVVRALLLLLLFMPLLDTVGERAQRRGKSAGGESPPHAGSCCRAPAGRPAHPHSLDRRKYKEL